MEKLGKRVQRSSDSKQSSCGSTNEASTITYPAFCGRDRSSVIDASTTYSGAARGGRHSSSNLRARHSPALDMKLWLALALAGALALAAALPRTRRALPEQSGESTSKPRQACAHQTPCGWSIYKPQSRIIELNVTNTYCVCEPGLSCVVTEDDTTAFAYVYHCRSRDDDHYILEPAGGGHL
ncbi:hypothetical protein JYU34_006016 [Plutella xylostella]|uniref:Uncharacterized protein n=2 Tax=Plutella xylostella TaxID=51655 RepID=A0ABQ7QUS2_PLUXY|nr:hypothetical protein JYU34_006016 [Plutella xylostella]